MSDSKRGAIQSGEYYPSIMCVNKESDDAKMVERAVCMVDGWAYYQSSGLNSGAKHFWLPFIYSHDGSQAYCKESDEESSFRYPFKIKLLDDDCRAIDYSDGYFFKFVKENLDIDSMKDDILAEYKGSNSSIKEILERISLKSALVTCLRLTRGTDFDKQQNNGILIEMTDTLLKTLGLTEDQINLSKRPIYIASPEQTIDLYQKKDTGPSEINTWLIENGAQYLVQIPHRKFTIASFSLLLNKPKNENADTSKDQHTEENFKPKRPKTSQD